MQKISVSFSDGLLAEVDRLRGGVPRSTWMGERLGELVAGCGDLPVPRAVPKARSVPSLAILSPVEAVARARSQVSIRSVHRPTCRCAVCKPVRG